MNFRPTFEFPTIEEPRVIIRKVKELVESRPGKYQGQFASEYAMIGSANNTRTFWSPWLQLEVRDYDNYRTVFGRFTPHPSIWTGIMFTYLFIVLSGFFGAMFGISQQLSNETPWGYLVIPIGAAIALVIWLAAQAGQKLTNQEMQDIQVEIENLLRKG